MTLTLDLDPFERCGPVRRGLPFARATDTLGLAGTPFRKSPGAPHDALDAGGRVHLHFDATGACKGVEVFIGKDVAVTLAGEDLLTPSGPSFVETLVRLGQHWDIDDYGIRAPMLGLATFHPAFDWDGGEKGIDALYISLDPDFVP